MDNLDKKVNRKADFFVVVGILTLVIAILGSTYAYFSVSATTGQNVITGSSAFTNEAQLSIDIQQISDGTGNLIPQLGSALSSAFTGAENKGKCIDANGNTICKAYSVKITNNTSVKLNVSGTFSLTANDMPYLKWAIGTMNGNAVSFPSATGSHYAKTVTALGNAVLESSASTSANNKTFYIIIWIEEQNNAQTDKNDFSGIVTFNGYIEGGDNTVVNGISSTIRG